MAGRGQARQDKAGKQGANKTMSRETDNALLFMWSAPGDTVYSPFTGIGSEGYMSIKLGRKFIGTELKPSYFRQAVGYLQSAESQPADLFSAGAA